MEQLSIQRRGNLLYSRAYLKLASAFTLLFVAVAALASAEAASRFASKLAGVILLAIAFGFIAASWLTFGAVIWFFNRRARQAVELNDEGIRETRNGREHAFIPWAGVKEIEIAATVFAGASLSVKGKFSDISISNIDLEITRPLGLVEMHRAFARTEQMHSLLAEVMRIAPQAVVRMNKLARRRLKLDTEFYERQV